MPLYYKNGLKRVNLEALDADELFDLIDNIPCDSDDDLEDIDEDELEEFETNDDGIDEENLGNLIDVPMEPCTSTAGRDVVWKKMNLDSPPCIFSGSTTLPQNIKDLQTPFQFFKFFFSDKL